jgi:hypothetical protein
MSTKYYLAGKMSGVPQFNFPLFFRVGKRLRELGYDVISPAEIDNEEDKGEALKSADGNPGARTGGGMCNNKTWGDFLSRDVKLLADGGIGGIIFLPGWEESSGAKLEATVGLLKNFTFMRWDDAMNAPVPYSRMSVACALHQEFVR